MSELKIGDKICTNAQYGQGVKIHVIERMTPTRYVSKDGTQFKKDGLGIVGADKYGPYKGRIPTESDIISSRASAAKHALKSLVIDAENIDAVEALLTNQRKQR